MASGAIMRIVNAGGDCRSAAHGAIDFHDRQRLLQQTCPFTETSGGESEENNRIIEHGLGAAYQK